MQSVAEADRNVLDVTGLKTVFGTREGYVHAVNGVNFHLKEGELLGIVGESGSGKSVTMMSLLKLLPSPPAEITDGCVMFGGRDLLKLAPNELRKVRGGEVGFISDAKPIRESASAYAQGTYNFTDRFRTIVGARFTNDEVRSSVTNFFGRSGTEMLQTTSEKLTGRLALEYDVGDATMFYGSITSGFKPGGSNLTFGREDVIAPILVLPTFQDESLISYELGVKSDFAGGRVRTSVEPATGIPIQPPSARARPST